MIRSEKTLTGFISFKVFWVYWSSNTQKKTKNSLLQSWKHTQAVCFSYEKSTQSLHSTCWRHLDFFDACELIRLISKGKKGGIPTVLNQKGHRFIIYAASHDILSINRRFTESDECLDSNRLRWNQTNE